MKTHFLLAGLMIVTTAAPSFSLASPDCATQMKEALAKLDEDAHAKALEDMPSNHNSDKTIVPQLKRFGGKVQVEWSGIRDRMVQTAKDEKIDPKELESLTASVYKNGIEVEKDIPWDRTSANMSEPPSGQMDYYVVYKNKKGEIVDTSKWAMRETSDGQNIAAGSFSGKYAGESFGFNLSKDLKAKGFSEELTETSVKLGNAKVVWVMNTDASSKVQKFLNSAEKGVDVKPEIGKKGTPTRITVTDRKTGKTMTASLKDFDFKVDAAFNGNAFFWDDMLVALATAPYHPWLAKSTVNFWLKVQKNNGGVIPREVRKENLKSLWFPENVRFPEKPKANLSYTNPYLMNWVADKVYRFDPSAENLAMLKDVSKSVDDYAEWMKKNRGLYDKDGNLVGFNGSSLGTGLDNSRPGKEDGFSGLGNNNEAQGHTHGFVDTMAQHIAMLKDSAQWNLVFARRAETASSKAAYAEKARTLNQEAVKLSKTMNEHYWNEEKGFYYDIDVHNGEVHQNTDHTVVSGFWPLYAAIADGKKMDRLVESMLHADAFGGDFPMPANARNTIKPGSTMNYTTHREHKDEDGYWDKWAHWPPMVMMVAQALRRSGRPDLAQKISGDFVRQMAKSSTKTVEESYGEIKKVAADGTVTFDSRPLQHASHPHRADFAGWGKGPGLENTMEDGLGIRPTYGKGLEWNLRSSLAIGDRQDILGVSSMQYMGGNVKEMSLRRLGQNSYELTVQSEKSFQMRLNSLLDNNEQVQAGIQARSQVVEIKASKKPQVIRIDLKPSRVANEE